MSQIEFIVTRETEWLAVDNEKIIRGGINHYGLADSAFETGEYHLEMMVEGCGSDLNVIVEHEHNKIHWHIPEQDGVPVARWFTFDVLQYRNALLEGFKKIPLMRNNSFRDPYSRYGISKKGIVSIIEQLKAAVPQSAPEHALDPILVWDNIQDRHP
jgi:hypothetical protein